ncbi:MAG: hypothetical protein LBL46_01745 [Rickettsiales bacterium]|jgi:hypothetical protein|nr:hypothetical protein [Rickettsiales bacterium]
MKKLIGFFSGLTIIAMTGAVLLAAIQLYEYAAKNIITPVLLQSADLHQNRIAAPIALADLSEAYIRNQLIIKYARAYLEVAPVADELSARATGQGALRSMSGPDALAKWKAGVLPELERIAAQKQMRRAFVDPRAIVQKGEYWVVPFSTKTWAAPNDLDIRPKTESGREMYIKLRFNKKVRTTLGGADFDAGRALDAGFPPSAVFEFVVDEVEIK